MALELQFTFPLKNGFHARPASRFQEIANKYVSAIAVVNEQTHAVANGKSTLSLLGSLTRFGDPCTLRVEGEDESGAMETFRKFLNEEFPLCDEELPPPTAGPGSNQDVPRALRGGDVQLFPGLAVSSGIAWAPAFVMSSRSLLLPAAAHLPVSAEGESSRIQKAIQDVEHRYSERARSASPGTEEDILKVHLSILQDSDFRSRISTGILNRHLTAGESVVAAAEHYGAMLRQAGTTYLQDRILDIRDVSAQLIQVLYGETGSDQEPRLARDAIVVAENLTPSQFLSLDKHFLKGMVLSQGGSTSHTVILARSLGLPTITGVIGAHERIAEGDDVILDAQRGLVILHPTERVAAFYRRELKITAATQEKLHSYTMQEGRSADGKRLEIAANAASVAEVEAAFRNGAEGIGLFRTEFLFMGRNAPPTEDEQFEVYRAAVQIAGRRPVIFRTLDVGGDKGVPYLRLPKEENPFLGYRAIRFYPEYKEIVESQLRAILRASAFGNAKLMFPMISSTEEVRSLRELTGEVMKGLQKEGVAFSGDMEIGIMVEIPSTAFIMDQLSQVADFFSIGSNDLTQYFHAVDRSNEKVKALYSSYTPSFVRLLKHIIDEAHKFGKWVGLCGELGGDRRALPLFLGLGFDEISLAPASIPGMKAGLAGLHVKESEALVENLVTLGSGSQIEGALREFERSKSSQCELIGEEIVQLASESRTKDEVIRELADLLRQEGRADDADKVEDAVWAREETYSTGIGYGVAIPHCKSTSVLANSVAFLKPVVPIAWGSQDDQPVAMVILIAINDTAKGEDHLKIIARLARRLMHEEFRQSLIDARSPGDVVNLLKDSVYA